MYLYEFELVGSLEIKPTTQPFGDVQIGKTSQTVVTVTNTTTAGNISITGLTFDTGSSPAFAITSPATLPTASNPIVLGPKQTVDVAITFTPTAPGLAAAVLYVTSNDPSHLSTAVRFSGNGVIVDTPSQVLADLLKWFDGNREGGHPHRERHRELRSGSAGRLPEHAQGDG